MTHVHVMALLMGLAPNPPAHFQHAPKPKGSARPDAEVYLEPFKEEASRHEYELDEGDDTAWSLYQEALSLREWFVGEGGHADMDAQSAMRDAVATLDYTAGSDAAVRAEKVAEQLTEALERFAVDYRAWRKARDEQDHAWATDRDVAWRSQWADRVMGAARSAFEAQ